jgi:hypothetical protein
VAAPVGRLADVVTINSPDAGADELEGAVRKLGFLGAASNGHTRGRYICGVFGRGHLRSCCRDSTPPAAGAVRPCEPVSTYLRQNVQYTSANFNDAATYANLVAQ